MDGIEGVLGRLGQAITRLEQVVERSTPTAVVEERAEPDAADAADDTLWDRMVALLADPNRVLPRLSASAVHVVDPAHPDAALELHADDAGAHMTLLHNGNVTADFGHWTLAEPDGLTGVALRVADDEGNDTFELHNGVVSARTFESDGGHGRILMGTDNGLELLFPDGSRAAALCVYGIHEEAVRPSVGLIFNDDGNVVLNLGQARGRPHLDFCPNRFPGLREDHGAAISLEQLQASVDHLHGLVDNPVTVKARRFEVIDPEGNVRGVFGIKPEDANLPVLALNDQDGTPRIVAEVDGEQGQWPAPYPMLRMRSENDNDTLVLGGETLRVYTDEDQGATMLDLGHEDGAGELSLHRLVDGVHEPYWCINAEAGDV